MTENEIIEFLDNIWTFGHKPTDEERLAANKAIDLIQELQKYRTIGTVEECREARERQRAKKVVISHNSCVKDNGKAFCPNCGLDIHGKGMVGYCFRCGQAISWESDTP